MNSLSCPLSLIAVISLMFLSDYSKAQPRDLTVNITFQVDMTLEDVSPDGVFISNEPTNWEPLPMTQTDGDIWSATLDLPFNYEVLYRYMNGTDGPESNQFLKLCGIEDGEGGYLRSYITGTSDIEVDVDCFSHCGSCDLVPVSSREATEAIYLYPNPATDQVHLNYDQPTGKPPKVEIIDFTGQSIHPVLTAKSDSGISLDVKDWPTGIYTVILSDAGELRKIKKLMVIK